MNTDAERGQPCTPGVDRYACVQIVRIVRFSGRIRHIGRYGRCQNVATGISAGRTSYPAIVKFSETGAERAPAELVAVMTSV
jgi:hypothetical protein